MNKKLHSFPFTKDGLEAAINYRETNKAVKYAPIVIALIGVTYLVCTAPVATVAFKPVAVEAAKEAFKLSISGGAL